MVSVARPCDLLRLFTSYGNAMYRNDPDAAEKIAEKFSAALASLASTAAAAPEPIGYMSEKQVPRITDPEGEFGQYIPMRKTPAGNFTLALYTAAPKEQR